jgi:hypothetical protein
MDPSPELRMTAVSALAGRQPRPVTNRNNREDKEHHKPRMGECPQKIVIKYSTLASELQLEKQ